MTFIYQMSNNRKHQHNWSDNQILIDSKLYQLSFCNICKIWKKTETDYESRKQTSELLSLRGYGKKRC